MSYGTSGRPGMNGGQQTGQKTNSISAALFLRVWLRDYIAVRCHGDRWRQRETPDNHNTCEAAAAAAAATQRWRVRSWRAF